MFSKKDRLSCKDENLWRALRYAFEFSRQLQLESICLSSLMLGTLRCLVDIGNLDSARSNLIEVSIKFFGVARCERVLGYVPIDLIEEVLVDTRVFELIRICESFSDVVKSVTSVDCKLSVSRSKQPSIIDGSLLSTAQTNLQIDPEVLQVLLRMLAAETAASADEVCYDWLQTRGITIAHESGQRYQSVSRIADVPPIWGRILNQSLAMSQRLSTRMLDESIITFVAGREVFCVKGHDCGEARMVELKQQGKFSSEAVNLAYFDTVRFPFVTAVDILLSEVVRVSKEE